MELFLLFLTAELLWAGTLSTLQMKARKAVLQKWLEGSLTIEELNRLKRTPWFCNQIWKPTKRKVSIEKKQN
jgi:hypothetical protein